MTENIPEKDQRHEGVIMVVLTADNHLGYAAFGPQPRKREEWQQRLRYAFQQAADFAVGQGVDLFIQAGDLFDTIAPDEQDRSFVAERLAKLKQAGIRTFALGGVHDTPTEVQPQSRTLPPAPQMSYASLGALHYLPPQQQRPLEPIMVDIRGTLVGICGLGVLAGQQGNPMVQLQVQDDIERAALSILVLHAPIEGLSNSSSLLDTHAQVQRSSILRQDIFDYILAGYHHNYSHTHIGQTQVIVAGATQHVDFSTHDHAPGFVFMGLTAGGLRWCNHIAIETLQLHRLTIRTEELWPTDKKEPPPTEHILERLYPLCDALAMIKLCLVGEVTRDQYHQLDLNRIRHYGEEHCFALAIDDSALTLLPEQEEKGERFSPREELISIADEWIAAASDEQEKKALRATKEELLLALVSIPSSGQEKTWSDNHDNPKAFDSRTI